jgi:hypothetical protein
MFHLPAFLEVAIEAFSNASATLKPKHKLGPVDKPVLAPARLERLGRRDTHVATGVTS